MPTFEKLPDKVDYLQARLRPRKKVYAIPGVDYKRMVERMDAFEASKTRDSPIKQLLPVGLILNESQDISVIPEDLSLYEPVEIVQIINDKPIQPAAIPQTDQTPLRDPVENRKSVLVEQCTLDQQVEDVPKQKSSKKLRSKRLSDLFISTATDLDTDLCDITSFLDHDTDLLTLARISDSE